MKIYNSLNLNNLPIKNPLCYTEDEINELFDLSEEEAVELTKVISNQVAINKVYSSQKTEERLAEILVEANQFATEQLGKSNFLSIDLATSVDEVVDEHILYLISDESGTNTYNQYVLINGEVKSLGSTQCDLTNYVTNDQLETKLEDYAKKNEVLSASDIVTTIDENSTDTTVPSSATVKTFVEDSLPEIVTTIDDTVTDEQVPSAKEINNFVNRRLVSTVSSVDEVNITDRSFQTFMIPITISESVGLPISPKSAWFVIHCSHAKNYKYPTQIAFEYAGAKRIMVRFSANGTWSEWRNICSTSHANVFKDFTSDELSAVSKTGLTITKARYYIKNGFATVFCAFSFENITVNVANSITSLVPMFPPVQTSQDFTYAVCKEKTSQTTCYGSVTTTGLFAVCFANAKSGTDYLYMATYPVSETATIPTIN